MYELTLNVSRPLMETRGLDIVDKDMSVYWWRSWMIRQPV